MRIYRKWILPALGLMLLSACAPKPGSTLNWSPDAQIPYTGTLVSNPAPLVSPSGAPPADASQTTRCHCLDGASGARPVNNMDGRQVVQLHHIEASDMQKIIGQVLPKSSATPMGSTHNVLILTGSEDERNAMLDVVNSFDADWLTGMSFGLFPLKEADAKVLTRELWDALGTPGGPLGKVVRLVTFDRLNAILVVSSQPRYLHNIKAWIERLDVKSAPSERKIWVYQVHNGHTAELSDTLKKLIYQQNDKADAPPMQTAILPIPAPTLPVSFDNSDDPIPPPPTPAAINRQMSKLTVQSGPRVMADEGNNSITIWANKSEYSSMQLELAKLDTVPVRVRIETVVAEVTLNDDLRYGVPYLFLSKRLGALLPKVSALAANAVPTGFTAFLTGSAVLHQLQSMTTVNVISSTQFMAPGNQVALLPVGDRVSVVGGKLKLIPHVTTGGLVSMDVVQEAIDFINTTDLDSPALQEHKIVSAVALRNGETVVLGGPLQDKPVHEKSGMPLLEDIPYLADIFGDTQKKNTRTELVVLITPRIVKNDDVSHVTDEIRTQLSAVEPLDTNIHR